MPFFCLIYQFPWKFSVHQKHKIINHENIHDFNDNGLGTMKVLDSSTKWSKKIR